MTYFQRKIIFSGSNEISVDSKTTRCIRDSICLMSVACTFENFVFPKMLRTVYVQPYCSKEAAPLIPVSSVIQVAYICRIHFALVTYPANPRNEQAASCFASACCSYTITSEIEKNEGRYRRSISQYNYSMHILSQSKHILIAAIQKTEVFYIEIR